MSQDLNPTPAASASPKSIQPAKQDQANKAKPMTVQDMSKELKEVEAEKSKLLNESKELRDRKFELKRRSDVIAVRLRDISEQMKKGASDPKLEGEQEAKIKEGLGVRQELDKVFKELYPFQRKLTPLFDRSKELQAKIRVLDPTGVCERTRDRRNFRMPMVRRDKAEREAELANERCQALNQQSQELKAKERELLSESELKARAAEEAKKPEEAAKIKAQALEQIKELQKQFQELRKAMTPVRTSRNGRRKSSTLEVMSQERIIRQTAKTKAEAREQIRSLRRQRKNARRGKGDQPKKSKGKSKDKSKK